ncbi:MAG: ABC transporter substrate-binding protein [Acidimicrobiales bacterium]|nr:ABC transporter substrate-binding protein [Acidimicrobiales bacterium]
MTSPCARLSRVRFGVFSAAATCLLLTACTSGQVGEADGELVIGTMLPLTGAEAEQGSAARAALEDQLGEIATASEFDDLQIRMVHTDVRSDAALVDEALDELLANNVDVVIGPPSTSQDAVTKSRLASAGVVLHLPLSQPPEPQAVMMADAIIADGHALVSMMLPIGTPVAMSDALASRLSDNGGTLLSHVEYEPSAERFDPEVAQVADDESTAVLVIGAGSTQSLVDALEAVGAGPSSRIVYVLGATSGITPTVGLRLIEPLAPLADRAGDRLVVASLAAAKAETDDPATIAGAVSEVVSGNTLCSSFDNCLNSLRNDSSVQFAGRGANGFDATGAPTAVPYSLTAYNADGEINEIDSRVITSG